MYGKIKFKIFANIIKLLSIKYLILSNVSIMISAKPDKLDFSAMEIIENAIHACGKFEFRSDKYAPQVYIDFQYVDHTLISSALQSIDFLR